MTHPQTRLRLIVCGTTFGQAYLKAIATLPMEFELVGILARGSAFARSCAEHYKVPLYTAVQSLPRSVDLACVVVRSGILGGAGSQIAHQLLERGIHVLQEQPVYPNELTDLLRTARTNKRRYRINGFYPNVAPVVRLINASRLVRKRSKLAFIDAACSIHVLYPLIDVLGRAIGRLRPWSFSLQNIVKPDQGPFTCIAGQIGGVPLTLRVQNQMDPKDPDNHIHLFHQIMLGTDAGRLLLVDSHGQLLWQPRMSIKRRNDGVIDLAAKHEALSLSVSSLIGPTIAPSYHETFNHCWTEAVVRELRISRKEI